MKQLLYILFAFTTWSSLNAQSSISGKSLIKNIEFLASDKLMGRWPGSAGDSAARKYIIAKFKQAGIKPLLNSYEQIFNVTTKLEAPIASNYLKTLAGTSLNINKDFSIFPFSGNGHLNAPIIISNGSSRKPLFKNHWVLLWRKKLNAPPTDSLSDYSLATQAIQNGAAGILFITPDSLDKNDVLIRLRPRKDATLGVPVVHLKRATCEKLLKELGLDPSITNENDTFFVSTQPLSASVNVETIHVPVANIVGIIPGSDSKLKNEYIILGAHYDHLGWGGFGTGSLKPGTTAIHNGADDNASGTSALIEIATALSKNRKNIQRSVIVIAFAAEEEGLLGSDYFASHLPIPKSSIKIMMNMDMVGRLNNNNNLFMGGAGTFPGGVDFMKSLEKDSGLNLVIHAGGVGGSDHVSFYKNGIPCIGFHTGGHPQYHTPEDDTEHINVFGIEKVSRYIYRAIFGLSNKVQNWNFIKQDG